MTSGSSNKLSFGAILFGTRKHAIPYSNSINLPLLLDKILEQTDNLLLAPPFSAKHLAWYVAFTGVKTSKEEGK